MITELTKEQEAMIPVYADRYMKIGLTTGSLPVNEAYEIVKEVYAKVLKKKCPPVVFTESPAAAWSVVLTYCRPEIKKLVKEELSGKITETIMAAFQQGFTPDKKIMAFLEEQVTEDVTTNVAKRVPFVWPYVDGHWTAGYFAFYDYIREVLKVEGYPPEWDTYRKTLQLGLMYPLDGLCVVSGRPTDIHMREGRLHKDGGMALKYADGWGLYVLNGVSVSKDIAETPADQMSTDLFVTERNAEVRREILRKIGVERLVTKLGAKVIDARDEYELLHVDLGGQTGVWPCLKMKNPSIGCYHMEWVNQDIKTVNEALKWRNQGATNKPEILT